MSAVENPKINIVGAGLGGALMAAYLGKAGYDVELYERRPDQREIGAFGGKSINLAVSARGIHALEEIGIAEKVLESAIPMRGRMIHSPSGGLSFQPYDKDRSRCINSISRAGLNMALLDAAEQYAGVRVHFDAKCVDADVEAPSATFRKGASDETFTADGDILIGADGAFSAVRGAMQRLDRFDYRQDYLRHGYKELVIPPGLKGEFLLEKNALHIWPRQSFMMIALPNADATFTCTLFWPFEGPVSFAALKTSDQIQRFFEREFPDAAALMPSLVEDYQRNPVGSLVTVRCGPWHCGGKTVLVGDAAHAIVPFYGQGMNAGFEDCTALSACIAEHAPDWGRAFERYFAMRKEHSDAIADLAIANFLEMRDHAASAGFRAQKRVERFLHGFVPGYVPLYTMVSFTRIPYAEAVRRARRQTGVVKAVAVILTAIIVMLFAWLILSVVWRDRL